MNPASPQFTINDRFLDQPYQLAHRVIDPISGTICWQGKREHLRRKELEVLALLASAEGRQVSRGNFIDVVWQGNDLVGDRGLTDTVVFLRKSLHDVDGDHPLIRTIPRRGYQLVVPVQAVASSPVQPVFQIGAMVPECPAWRLVRLLSQSPESDNWLAERSEFGESEQGVRVFRFCKSEAHLQRLRREVTILRYLREALGAHPHFALIEDWQLEEPPYFLAYRQTSFASIGDWGELAVQSDATKLRLMHELTDAVAAMHALGVVHGRLSAQSILVDVSPSNVQLKLSAFDWGVLGDRSKLAPLNITAAGLTLGTEHNSKSGSAADDVAALVPMLVQIALADVQLDVDDAALNRLSDTKLQSVLRSAMASSQTSAEALSQQLKALRTDVAVADVVTAASANHTPDIAPDFPTAPQAEAARNVAVLRAPERIGNYRLLDKLGEGGMGTVYSAEGREPYRKVALKIIRSGLDGRQILSRFEAERQALAMMNHPNVATVLDSGMAEDGRPYFAMEYIIGEDITRHCNARRLGISARIELFLQVCDGVLHAHQKGVLHRDIKPSNLMVSSASDNQGTLKIIDFGLAKSLHGKLAAHTLHTSFGAFIGTPVYSSPEHISGASTGVDTRSDIYAMGVVLYELLAGRTPIASESLENLEPEKLREMVCKSKLPSMREQLQSGSVEQRAAIAEQRAMKADELPKTLEGDLSWVVGKCLEKDPNDRYGSVLELKKDLERWLGSRPVEARPTSGWYRFTKLVRRNRRATMAIALSIGALLGMTTLAFSGFVRADRALAQTKLAAGFQQKQIEKNRFERDGARLAYRSGPSASLAKASRMGLGPASKKRSPIAASRSISVPIMRSKRTISGRYKKPASLRQS